MRQMLRTGAPDTCEESASFAQGPPSTPPLPPQAPEDVAAKEAARGEGDAPSSVTKGKTGRRADFGDSAQPRGLPTGVPATAGDAVQPLEPAVGAAPGDRA